MSSEDQKHRSHLPMPNTGEERSDYLRCEGSGLEIPADRAIETTKGCPQCPDSPDRRRRLRRDQRLWRALPDTKHGKAGRGGIEVQPLPHHCAVLADAAGAADRPQPSFRRHGRHHRDCHRGAGLLLGAPQLDVAAGEDTETQRLFHRAIRQVPRSAGVGDESGRAVRRMADRRRRLRVLLRIHRRRGQPVVPDALRRHHARRAREDAGGGLSPGRGHDRQGHRLDRAAEESRAGQAVFHLLRAGGDARAAPRAERVGRQVQGQVRSGLGHVARGDLRPAEEAGRDPAGLPAHGAPQGDPVLGRDAGRIQAGASPRDGSVRGLHGIHGSPRRPAVRVIDEAGHRRRHAHLLHRRRQRRLRRRIAQRLLQRDELLQRSAGARDA